MLCFACGVMQILVFLDTNMFVYRMQNSHVGGVTQHEPPTREVLRCSGIKAINPYPDMAPIRLTFMTSPYNL